MISHPKTQPEHFPQPPATQSSPFPLSSLYEEWLAALIPTMPQSEPAPIQWSEERLRQLITEYIEHRQSNEVLGEDLAELARGSSRVLALACNILAESETLITSQEIADFVTGYCQRAQELVLSDPAVADQASLGVSWDAQRALFESESRFRAVFERAPIGILICDMDGRIISINPILLGYLGQNLDSVVGKHVDELLASNEERAWIGHHYETLLQSPDGRDEIEGMLHLAGGHAFWASIVASIVREEDGTPRFIISLVEDISVQHAYENSLRQNENRVRQLIQHSSDLLAVVNTTGQVAFISPNVEQILGYQVRELGGRAFDILIAEDDKPIFDQTLAKLQDKEPATSIRAEIRCVQKNQTWRWMEFSFTRMEGNWSTGRVVINARDMTERREFQKQLERQAYYDGLTALPNRLKFRIDLERAIENDVDVAVLFIDLDRFKMINDSQDHGGGDHAIVAVGQRIFESLLPGEMIGRFGGDEFAVWIADATEQKAVDAAQRVLQALERPLALQHLDASVPCSIGIALSNEHQKTANGLLRAADIAMYKAKSQGGAQAVLFEPEMLDEAMARTELAAALHGVLERNELETWFLPEYDLITGKLAAFETVVRWRRPGYGLLALNDFRDSALDLGLMPRINSWMVEDATRQVMTWMNGGIDPDCLVFSVAYAHPHRGPEKFLAKLAETLKETGIDPCRLRIDLDSRAITLADLEPSGIGPQLQALGVEVGIDHFGAGPNTLASLQRIGATAVKVNGGFPGISDDSNVQQTAFNAICTLARVIAGGVTATGLDTPERVEMARRAGCERGLGLALSGAQSAAGMERLLRSI